MRPQERLALPLLLALSLLLAACGPPVPRLAPLPADATILAFGDSLTFGTGAKPGESYPAHLERLTGYRVINAGIPGEITRRGAERLPDLLDEHAPSLLLLCHGGNDLLRRLDRGETVTNLRAMIEAARSREIPVVLLGVPEPTLFLLESAEFYGQLAKEYQLPLEADILPAVESRPSVKSDKIHPNGEGYRQIAEAVKTLLQRAGAL